MNRKPLSIAMLCIHSSPIGTLGTKDTGGMSIYIRELARRLGECNHCVDIFTHQNGPQHPPVMVLGHNIRLVHLSNGGPPPGTKEGFLSVLPHYFQDLTVFKDVQARHYDLVHSHYWLSGPLGVWARDSWDVPHVITFHTLGKVKNHVTAGTQEPAVRTDTEQSLVQSCLRILSATEQEKHHLEDYYGASAEKVGIVPCGVDFEQFFPQERGFARRQLRLARKKCVLLYVGRFDKLKGIECLLEAMTLIENSGDVVLLVVGGDGPEDRESKLLVKLCRDWRLEEKVRFCGVVDHNLLPIYYSAADALVIPSLYESFSLVALEALACGTPVLSTRVGAMESFIEEGLNGRIIPHADPRSLASAIDHFVEQSSLYPFSREMIRESARLYTWDNAATALLREYATACIS